ncbi:MAG: hypothetical protein GYA57_01875 [Myxococcales bacterium]|nr:hypothetical protein [Myxococcales bacterium]
MSRNVVLALVFVIVMLLVALVVVFVTRSPGPACGPPAPPGLLDPPPV